MLGETTTGDKTNVVSTLNTLIETCKDGERGFKKASEDIKNASYKSLFLTFASQRAQFAATLQQHVSRLGGSPTQAGSVVGAIHRGWIDVKSAVTGRDEHAILEECERGEDAAKKNYEDALRKPLPADLMAVVEQQYTSVKAVHDQVKNRRDTQV